MTEPQIRSLSGFSGEGYCKGRSLAWQVAWIAVDASVFRRVWLPSGVRIAILRAFGAHIGRGVLIRQGVRVHWPWKLSVGDHTWIGVDVWLLNLEAIRIGSDVCISQEALICTGSHDRRSPTFEFDNAAIEIEDGCWVAVRATVLRGVRLARGTTVAAGAVVRKSTSPYETVF